MKLKRIFFEQKTLKVAKELLGCFLIHQVGDLKIIARIIETEAYVGPKDKANHASKGITKRTEVMFGSAGHAYIYLIYGMYYCFNIVTESKGYPAAVLIRGIEIAGQKFIGPGKVCRELKIDKSLNNEDIVKSKKLWLEKGHKSTKIKKLSRVGIDYASEYKDKLWRFLLEN